MYHSFTVRIPDAKGKIVTMKKGQSTYVLYQYGSVYNPEKKYAVPKRAIIGKVCPDDPGSMYPNSNFVTYFPDSMPQKESLPFGRSFCLKIGLYAVISHIAEEYGLSPMLARYFGALDAAMILDLASFLIAGNGHIDGYAFDHPLFSASLPPEVDGHGAAVLLNGRPLSPCRPLEGRSARGFLYDWVKSRGNHGRICITQDLADKSLEPGNTYIADFGTAGSARECLVHNVAVAMDAANRIPLFYAEYPGSACDVSQFSFMAEEAKKFGFAKLLFIFDRGPFCREHIR